MPTIKILECDECGLVSLDSTDHIHSSFYENSGMHGEYPKPIEDWIRETSWDDQRRVEQLKTLLINKRILDFGCGAGGFLLKAKNLVAEAVGIELETRIREYWKDTDITILPSIEDATSSSSCGYDIITAFHVLEHLPDPREMLISLGRFLNTNGRMIIEVPNADDALLSIFDCNEFQLFTYWSQHLYLFNASTLATLVKQAGLKVVSIHHYQRYPLSNHLHWLSKGKPGGHVNWSFLDNPTMTHAYSEVLASIGKTDTLIAYIEK
jgi:2-polyprenyl-3-methyl-5-hydroxy-6-metoxy-1,4-benzoquinol methylase